ncbi:MAG: MFS transporter [Defluviitaleaceae bacterium]|nr:MFS transporter [Defluviitaleaceae bacterium]
MVNKKRNMSLLLAVILLSYFVVGFPDGAFTVSWIPIFGEMDLGLAHSGYILVGYSVTYTLAGVLLSRLNRYIKLQTVYLLGLLLMGAGFVWLALSPNFVMVLLSIALYGFGTGLMASSMNSYMAKHFTARHNNWMHCFWGGGATLSPIIMAQLIGVLSWRAGYFVITGILGVVAIILLVSMYKKIWIDETEGAKAEATQEVKRERFLEKKWHQAVEIATFFFLGGTDYTLVFFTGMVITERFAAQGLAVNVGIFSAVYYAFMTGGRMFFGWTAKWLREVPIVRIGCGIAVAGILTLHFTSNVAGMALTGFGLAPLLPTLVSDTSNRFRPAVINKLVGYELAAFGAGIAVLFFATSLVLEHITLELLFPIGIAFVGLVFVCNELLERAVRK